MAHLEYCSNCGEKNIFGMIEGQNRFHCESCKKIHYENPKPTATLVCVKESKLLLVDLKHMGFRTIKITKDKKCRICN